MNSATDWNILVQRSLTGEDSAFDELYSLVYPMVVNFIESRFGRVHFAEDLASETLFKVWKHLERYSDTRASFLVWVFQIAYYTTVDFVRRKKNQSFLPIENAYSVADKYSPGKGLSEKDAEVVRRQVLTIPKQNRSVLIERIYFGQSNEEISKRENLKVGTVKSRYRLALEFLRTRFPGEKEDWI